MEKRLNHHLMQDGLLEILLGIWLLLFSLHSWLSQGITTTIFNFLLIAIVPLLFGPLLQWLKSHISDPRIGYVKPVESPQNQQTRLWMISLAIILLILFALLGWAVTTWSTTISAQLFQLLPLSATLIFVVLFFYIAHRYQINRFLIYATLMFILTAGIIIASIGLRPSMTLFMFGGSMITLIGGLLTLQRFIRQHPVADIEMEDIR